MLSRNQPEIQICSKTLSPQQPVQVMKGRENKHINRPTSPRILKRDDLPQPFGPHTRTFIPDLTSKFNSFTRTSPLGVTSGTFSNRMTLSSLTTLPAPGMRRCLNPPKMTHKQFQLLLVQFTCVSSLMQLLQCAPEIPVLFSLAYGSAVIIMIHYHDGKIQYSTTIHK